MDKTILKQLINSEVLDEETKDKIATAFQTALDEAKAEQEKDLRAELAERYEQEKKAIHAALESFLEQELTEHVDELRQGVNQVNDMKAQYADKITDVKAQAQGYVQNRLGAVEKVVEAVLQKELNELHESEKVNRRAYLQTITEAQAKASTDYNLFKEKGAVVLESITSNMIQGMLEELRKDIVRANQDNFGREVYESFMTTFRRQFFNSNKEFRNLVTQNKKMKTVMHSLKEEANQKIRKANIKAETAEKSKVAMETRVVRTRAINQMLRPLSGRAREKMGVLLENTRTSDLQKTYKKFLPEILSESQRKVPTPRPKAKRPLNEKRRVELKTGGKDLITERDDLDDELEELRSRAGMLG